MREGRGTGVQFVLVWRRGAWVGSGNFRKALGTKRRDVMPLGARCFRHMWFGGGVRLWLLLLNPSNRKQ